MSERHVVDFDHHSEEFAADPWGALKTLRDRCPVAWTEAHGGYWAVTGYEALATVARDDVTFSSRHDEPLLEAKYGGIMIPNPPFQNSFIEKDPPELGEYRKAVNWFFGPAHVDSLEPRVRAFAAELLDARTSAGALDLVLDYASPVPAMATLDSLGLDLDDWHLYAEPIHTMSHARPGTPEHTASIERCGELLDRIMHDIQDRKERPRDDFLTQLTTLEVGGKRLDEMEVRNLVQLIVGGGVDTTTSATASSLVYLDQNRDARQDLIDHPEKMRYACEEFLRCFAPVMGLARTVARDTELGGQQLCEGERLWLCWASANRDVAMFERPDEVILDRFPNKHTTFGLGAHRCIGSNFARMELRVMVEEVLRRIPDYAIDHGAAELYPTVGLNYGYINLPATFEPKQPSTASAA